MYVILLDTADKLSLNLYKCLWPQVRNIKKSAWPAISVPATNVDQVFWDQPPAIVLNKHATHRSSLFYD